MLNVTISLGGNTFSSSGDFTFDQGFQDVLCIWVNAQSADEDARKFDEVVAQLKASNREAQAVVDANTPK